MALYPIQAWHGTLQGSSPREKGPSHGTAGEEPSPRQALAHPRRDRAGPADGRPRRDDREHRPALRPGRPGLLRRQPPVGHHGLRAGIRIPAAARWADQRPDRAQVDVHHRPARVRRGVRPGGSRSEFRGPDRSAGTPGSVRRVARARGALDPHDDLHEPHRARQGVRRLRRPRRQRGSHRPAPGRSPYRGLLMAGDDVREPRLRTAGGRRRLGAPGESAPGGSRPHRRARRDRRHRRALRPGVRVHDGRAGGLGGAGDDRSARRVRPGPRRIRPDRAAGGEPAAAASGGGRPQSRWRLPRGRSVRHRDVRRVPVPDVLPSGEPRLLADSGRAGIPPDGGDDHARLGDLVLAAAAALRASATGAHGHGDRRSRPRIPHRHRRRLELRGRCAARA